MNQESNNNQSPGFWNWGRGLAVVIVLFIVTTLSVVFYLVSLDYYMVNENHYEKAVEYQQQIERIEHTTALQQRVGIKRGGSAIQISFPDSLAALAPTGSITLYRPSNSALDRSFKLALDTQGRQDIPASDLQKGKWVVQLNWNSGDKDYFQEEVIFL